MRAIVAVAVASLAMSGCHSEKSAAPQPQPSTSGSSREEGSAAPATPEPAKTAEALATSSAAPGPLPPNASPAAREEVLRRLMSGELSAKTLPVTISDENTGYVLSRFDDLTTIRVPLRPPGPALAPGNAPVPSSSADAFDRF